MNYQQHEKCERIIERAAKMSSAANLSPIIGTGEAADVMIIGKMAIELARVLDRTISEGAARGVAAAAIKQLLISSPVKTAAKSFLRFIPLGTIASAGLGYHFTKTAGWTIARSLDRD